MQKGSFSGHGPRPFKALLTLDQLHKAPTLWCDARKAARRENATSKPYAHG